LYALGIAAAARLQPFMLDWQDGARGSPVLCKAHTLRSTAVRVHEVSAFWKRHNPHAIPGFTESALRSYPVSTFMQSAMQAQHSGAEWVMSGFQAECTRSFLAVARQRVPMLLVAPPPPGTIELSVQRVETRDGG
jgi:hypothetical protein